MKSLDQEINSVKTEILNNFVEVFYNNELKKFITLNSKFIRSKIAILYFKTLGYEINDQIYKVLAIGEIIHCASLLHDDVLDEAEMRRGQKTLSKEFSSKVSILAGDYLLTHAIDKIQSLNNAQIMNLFNICTKNMIKAEINQYFLRKKIPDLESYLNVCKGKTADLF